MDWFDLTLTSIDSDQILQNNINFGTVMVQKEVLPGF